MKKLLYFGTALLAAVSIALPLLPTTAQAANAVPACTKDERITGSKEELQPCADPALSANKCSGAGSCETIREYVQPFVDFLAAFVGVAVVIAMIYGGIEYSSSGGDPQKAASGKKRIRNAIFALLLFLFFYSFLRFILLPGNVF